MSQLTSRLLQQHLDIFHCLGGLCASITHMQVLTPISSLEGAAAFLAANLYARSSFGEDAIMNVSVEKRSDGSIKGHIRIRAKTQGVALSLGDRITAQQKVDVPPKPHE